MASKPKSSSVSESPNKTPRVSKRVIAKSETDSLQTSRLSIDRSPRPSVDRRSPKLTPPEKQPTRLAKGSDLPEDLKKANQHIVLLEKEKSKAIDDLKEAQKLVDEANEKLREAFVAQKRAEETSEIEKFRALELEQAGIEAAHNKEKEWEKELESVKNQHALDVAALLSTTQELQRLQHELAMTCDAKNQALSHADDATKIAEIHAEKADFLSAELARLKALLDSKLALEAHQNNKIVLELNSQLDKAKDELIDKDVCIEHLNVELEASRMAESYARSVVEELKTRTAELEMQLHESERSASESLESVMKQLEGSNDLLHNARSEVASLKGKMSLLEITVERQKVDLEESELCLGITKDETSEMAKQVESLKSQLEAVKEEKIQALNKEKLAASSVQALLEEKNKLVSELESSRNEEDKSKKAMESLASALHEVSAEAREAKEKLLSSQVEHDSYESQMEDLKLVLKATNEKYQKLLDEAKQEIDSLTSSVEQSKAEFNDSKVEWEEKEVQLVNCVRKSEEENSSAQKEVNRLVNLLKKAEEEVCGMKEEEGQLKDSLKEVEGEVIYLQEAISEVKAECMKLKESLMDKENELQFVIQENEDLRAKEASALKRAEELSKMLEEATANKQNGEVTDSEKDYDLLPKVVEFSEENGHDSDQHNKTVNITGAAKIETLNEKEDESEYKMWESCKIEKKEFSPTEQGSFEDEVESKVDGGESFDQMNGEDGSISPSKQQQQKKKKPLLRKFGNLLKKKGSSNQK